MGKLFASNSKSIVFVIIILCSQLLFVEKVYGQILAWEFNGNSGSETTDNSTTTNANLNTSTIRKGAGLSNPSGSNAFTGSFGAVGYSTGTTSLATAISAQEYLQFTVQAKAGFLVSLSTLNATFLRSTANAPDIFQWQYSLDDFTTAGVNIGSSITYSLFSTGSAPNGTAQAQINLSGIAALQGVGNSTTITIRLYGWSANNTGSTFAIGKLSGNDLAIGGTVTVACTPPPAPQVTSPINLCQNSTAIPLTAIGSNLLWYEGPTGGTGSETAPTPLTTIPGTTLYHVSQTTGCEGSRAEIEVIINEQPKANVIDKSDINCFGASDGSITITASLGITPYSFSVDDGATWHSPTLGETMSVIGGLQANTIYRIRVKDGNECVSK